MKRRPLGSLDVSTVGLGCNNFGRRIDASQTQRVVRAALDAGISFFDTADVYGDGASEEYLGAALGDRRDEAVIATKFGMQFGDDPDQQGASPRWVRRSLEGSLRRLGTDRVDLYQLHRPDDTVPIEETLGVLEELVAAGKVREIGNSNFTGQKIEEAERAADRHATARFVSSQNHWNLLERTVEEDVVPACRRLGLSMLPYFPLASGVLTGKYRLGEDPPSGSRLGSIPADRAERFLNEDNLRRAAALEEYAAEHGRTLLELAFSWLASHDVVASVIAGATEPEQVRANADAAGWALTSEQRAEVDRLTDRG